MFIAHYKSVNSPEEFFSSKRKTLDFPTQVEYLSKRYLLFSTYHADTNSQVQRIESFATANSIPFGVEL